MKKIGRVCIFIIFYFLIFINLICWSFDAPGATELGKYGASFLQINSGAKQVAMANAFTALAYDDINLLRYNIGGLGSIRNVMLAINYHKWIEDTQQGALGLALPIRYGVIGFDFTYFNEGELTEIDQNFAPTGNIVKSNDIALTLGYGSLLRLLNKKFLFGGGFKVIQQNLAQESATALGLDLGILLRLKHLSFGVTIQNFGITKLKFIQKKESLPEMYRAGIGGHFNWGDYIHLNLDVDIAHEPDQSLRYYSGTEITIGNLFMIRGGYKFHNFEANRWAAGIGLLIPMEWLASSETRLDYAYSPLNAFESSTHRFSLLFRFGVPIQLKALNVPDEKRLAEINEKLKKQLEAAEKARLAAEEAEMRTRALEDTLRARLARIKKIAEQSGGKIEVVETATAPGKIQDRILISMRINFDFDKANIRPEEYETMQRIGEILNTYPQSQVFVSGHTDYIGSHEYNLRLSQERVDSVMAFLTTKGNIDFNRFYNPIGYGELKPVADNTTEAGRFRNRRVDFLIYTTDAKPEMPEASAIKSVELVNDSTIHIVGNGKMTFTHKLMSNPDRLVLDFPHIFLLTDYTSYELQKGPFIRARLGYHSEKIFSRVVIDLYKPIQYEIESEENMVIIRLTF